MEESSAMNRTGENRALEGSGGGWATVAGAFICLILSPSTMAMLSFGIFTPYLIESFGWSVAEISLGATFISLATIVAALAQGVLADRFGARRLILWSAPAFGLGYAMFAFQTGQLWQFYLGWLLLPLLGVGLWPGSYARATASWFSRTLALAMALATVGIGFGTMVLPLLIGMLIGSSGWRTAYLVVGILAAVLVWSTAFLCIRERPSEGVRQVSGGRARVFPWEVVSLPVFRKLALAFLLLGVVSSLITTHQVLLLVANGVSRADAIQMQVFTGAALILGRIATGYLVDRIGVRPVMAAFCGLAAVGVALLLGGATGWAAACAVALLGMLVGAEIDIMGFVAKTHFPMAIYGAIYGSVFALFHLGNAIGASAIAALQSASGSYGPALVGILLLLAIIALAFATLDRSSAQTAAQAA